MSELENNTSLILLAKWDTCLLYTSLDDEQIIADLAQLEKLVAEFRSSYMDLVATLSATEFLKMLKREEEMNSIISKIKLFYILCETLNQVDTTILSRRNSFEHVVSRTISNLQFVPNELANNQNYVAQFKNSPILQDYIEFFSQLQVEQTHAIVSNPPGQLTKSPHPTSSQLVQRYQTIIHRNNSTLTDSEIIECAEIFAGIVKNWTDSLTIRSFTNVMGPHLQHERLSEAMVKTMLKEIKNSYPLFTTFEQKQTILPTFNFDEAWKVIITAFTQFDPAMAQYAQWLLENGYIDAQSTSTKRKSAFSTSIYSHHSFISIQYINTWASVVTLAHELGHAWHAHLSQVQPSQVFDSPHCVGEIISTFCELLVWKTLLDESSSDEFPNIFNSFVTHILNTIFVQARTTFFELDIYEKSLQNIPINEILISKTWNNHTRTLYESTKSTPSTFPSGQWVNNSHIFTAPFYCISYPFGQLMALQLFSMLTIPSSHDTPESTEKGKARCVEIISNICMNGGNRTPQNIMSRFDIDLENPETYKKIFVYLSKLVSKSTFKSSQIIYR